MSDKQHSEFQNETAASGRGIPLRIWLMFSILLLLALAVIFVLPRVVEQYELPFTQRTADGPAVPVDLESAPTLNPVSPFDEAQRSRQRREAQDILSSLLSTQEELDELEVQSWAAGRYEDAVASAREGDEHYRNGRFARSIEAYREADMVFDELMDSVPSVFEELMREAEAAMERAEADVAEERYRLALVLDPDSEAAATGLERSRTLEEVEELLRRAAHLQDDGRLERARERLEEAVALDSGHDEAQRMLTRNRELIRDAEFTRYMSRGFTLLQNNEPDQAIAAFERAQNIRPEAEQPREAIEQTREQLTNAAIARHRSQAREFEEQEQWADAVEEYRAALNLDPNLVFAAEGLDYAERRLRLDRLLQQALNNPERLGDEEVYEYTVEVYRTGAGLDEQGPRLERQLEELDDLLTRAREPVDVRILSDNETRVRIYQVGELGRFESMELSLRPGRYVAVGTRDGYRDVREEFVVGFGRDPEPIRIECEEPIVATGGR